jgi:hypothetical protein
MDQKTIVQTGSKSSEKKSRLQLQYESLTEKIEVKKTLLRNLEEGMRNALPKILQELKPLLNKELESFKRRIIRLDEVAEELSVNKMMREYFDEYMIQEINHLLNKGLSDDTDLLLLLEKYSYGVKESSPEQNRIDDFDFEEIPEEEYSFKKPAGKSSKKKEKILLEKDAKAVYLKLMKEFHPDRVQDSQMKEQYTEISTKIIKSYKDKDFQTLLKLQIEHLDETVAKSSDVADTILNRYNKILQQQLNELELELELARSRTKGLYEDFFDYNHQFSTTKFHRVKKNIRQNIELIEGDLKDSYSQKKGWFKNWISAIKEITVERMLSNKYKF